MMANADTPNARLQTAAQQNDVIGLERELADGAEVDYIDPVFCWTALHIASLDGKSDAVDILLRAGASPDIVNDGGNTALHMASRNGQVRCVALLCNAGANLDIVNDAGKVARQEAAERVSRQFRYTGTSHKGVLEVIDGEAERREWPRCCAALQRLAFAAGMHERLGSASVLHTIGLPRRTEDGCWELIDFVITPCTAAHSSRGATATPGIQKPLHDACHIPTETLRRAKSDGWAWRDHQNKSSGVSCARSSQASTDEAEPPSQRHLKGQLGKIVGNTWVPTGSALHEAINTGNLSAVQSELAEGTSTECVNQGYLETPLHRAAVKGNATVVQELLAANANVQAKRSGGFTPLHTAQTTEVARLLMDSGADPSAKADNGNTPAQQAAGGEKVQSFIAEYQPRFSHRCMYGNPQVPTKKKS